ncbi:MAG: Eco57I restriction-modification methylase domain-containing protein, partial [Roseimicrobium sp.]
DADDTVLHLDKVHRDLKEHLRWPTDERKVDEWRRKWGGAFTLAHRYVITTAQDLALRLAELAVQIRVKANQVLRVESSTGPLRKLQKAFQQALIHDLTDDGFADLYAQTISYGLLSARIMEGPKSTADSLADRIPITNPFLKELLQSFLKAGGRAGRSGKGGIDFDELGVSDIVDLLNSPTTNMEAVLRDFGNKTRGEDPVLHFYEHFLGAYDKKQKVQRGVFYTPQPVVSFIVRSVHELLQTEFGLADGLADTTTWGEMQKKHPGLVLPPLTDEPGEKRTISPDEPFVQILDPATGTATFLVEVIDVIHRTLSAKWKQQRLNDAQQRAAWNDYVPKHLLPRLHAFELLMAPYAVAHMKISLKLAETGYRFGTAERARIYLTNALEPWVKQVPLIGFEALAHEAAAVNEIKRYKRFTIIIGNPPYSRVSQNQSAFIQRLMKDYKEPVSDEANQQPLDDDYIKCLRLAHYLQSMTRCGIIGFITNHTVISGVLFRGVRQRLLEDQNLVAVADLHGNSNIKERCADGSKDENVFDIQAGVAVTIGVKAPWLESLRCVFHELWGLRVAKYAALARLTIAHVR